MRPFPFCLVTSRIFSTNFDACGKFRRTQAHYGSLLSEHNDPFSIRAVRRCLLLIPSNLRVIWHQQLNPKLREMSLTKCLVHCEEKFCFDLLRFHYGCDSMTVFLVRNCDINKIIRQIIQAFWDIDKAFLPGTSLTRHIDVALLFS